MRLPLTDTGVPFSGTRIVQDYRGDLQNTPDIVRFVTVFALNTDTGGTANFTGTLITPGGNVALPTTVLAALAAGTTPTKVLDRFPLQGEVALQVQGAAGVMLSGYVEFSAGESGLSPTVFTSAPAASPFVAPTATFEATDGEVTLHALNTVLQEVTLTIDVPDATAQFEVFFYEDDSVFESFVFEGLLPAMTILDRIPMYSPGSIRVQALTGPHAHAFAAYGTTILR